MMTLSAFLTWNPPSVIPAFEPTPRTDVLEMILMIPQPVRVPLTLMTPPALAAAVRPAQSETVVPAPDPPPVVPAAKPTSSLTAAALFSMGAAETAPAAARTVASSKKRMLMVGWLVKNVIGKNGSLEENGKNE